MRWLGAVLLLLSGCGYVGDPLPPALEIPAGITDLRAVQIADRIVIELTLPALTTEELPVSKVSLLEIRIGDKTFQPDVPAAQAFKLEQPSEEFAGQEVVVSARTAGPRGRWSAWSNLVSLPVIEPLVAPTVKASSHPDGVKLTWQGQARPGVKHLVSRSSAEEPAMTQLGTVELPEFIDTTAQAGKAYQYSVQASFGTALSKPSLPVAITPADTFAPAAPTGLVAVAGLGTIELGWDRNTEADFRGYRVYREMEALAGPMDAPAYTDKQVVSGKTYRYAVTSIDQLGNESPRSEAVEVVAP